MKPHTAERLIPQLMPQSLHGLSIPDLRLIESSLSMRIEALSAFLKPDADKNVLWLTLAPEGIKLKHKTDFVQQEISRLDVLLEKVQKAILNY